MLFSENHEYRKCGKCGIKTNRWMKTRMLRNSIICEKCVFEVLLSRPAKKRRVGRLAA